PSCAAGWRVSRPDVQVSRLRGVLADDPAHPRFIQTVWGVGYVFIPDGAPGPASTGTPLEPQ
ncbi:MAG: winged helix-turn-helix domain-containing protein, partial [Betaproteobacteria bacterium]